MLQKQFQLNIMPLDDLIQEKVDLLKINVRRGRTRGSGGGWPSILTANPDIQLIIEWNPLIQQMAGYTPGELPKFLIESGFELATIDRESERLGALNLEDIHTICSELTHNRSKYLGYWYNIYAVRASHIANSRFNEW